MFLVDAESGSIRPHRPLCFDPPWEKMKGTEKGIENREEQGAGKRGLSSTGGFGKGQWDIISYVNSHPSVD